MATNTRVAANITTKSLLELTELDCSSGGDNEGDDTDGSNRDGSDGTASMSDVKQGGMADAMARILGKKVPKHQTPILAKGNTDKEIRKRKQQREAEERSDDDDIKKIKEDGLRTTVSDRNMKKKLWEEMGKIKPSPLDKIHERHLQKIATRGVVQLFNAVRQQQKILDDKLSEVSSERRKEKVVESMTKRKFMDILKGTPVNVSTETITHTARKQSKKKSTEPAADQDEGMWNILRDDFMMGAVMKDWDKEGSEGEEGGSSEEEDMASSDSSGE